MDVCSAQYGSGRDHLAGAVSTPVPFAQGILNNANPSDANKGLFRAQTRTHYNSAEKPIQSRVWRALLFP